MNFFCPPHGIGRPWLSIRPVEFRLILKIIWGFKLTIMKTSIINVYRYTKTSEIETPSDSLILKYARYLCNARLRNSCLSSQSVNRLGLKASFIVSCFIRILMSGGIEAYISLCTGLANVVLGKITYIYFRRSGTFSCIKFYILIFGKFLFLWAFGKINTLVMYACFNLFKSFFSV